MVSDRADEALNLAGSEGDIVNWDEALERVAGNEDLLKRLLKVVAGTLDSDLTEMEELLNKNDFDGLAAKVHSLKGSAGNLSIIRVYEQSSQLEKAAKDKDAEGAGKALEALKAATQEFLDWLGI